MLALHCGSRIAQMGSSLPLLALGSLRMRAARRRRNRGSRGLRSEHHQRRNEDVERPIVAGHLAGAEEHQLERWSGIPREGIPADLPLEPAQRPRGVVDLVLAELDLDCAPATIIQLDDSVYLESIGISIEQNRGIFGIRLEDICGAV